MVFLNAAPAGAAGFLGNPIFMFLIIIAIMYLYKAKEGEGI